MVSPLASEFKKTRKHKFNIVYLEQEVRAIICHAWCLASNLYGEPSCSPGSDLMPTHLHDVVRGGCGHLWLEEAVTHGDQGNHLVVLVLFERHQPLGENFPHQDTLV